MVTNIETQQLFMHIATRETLICYPSELPDYVCILKRNYWVDYSSEYISLGPICFTDDDIYIDKGFSSVMLPVGFKATKQGDQLLIEKVPEIPWYQDFFKWVMLRLKGYK